MAEMPAGIRDLVWVGSSKRDLCRFPEPVKDGMGFALYRAQQGAKHVSAKVLKGFGGAGVLEVVEDQDGSTYRAVYTVKFASAVYVLHAFQKKSVRGIRTAQHDMDLIAERLKAAKLLDQQQGRGGHEKHR